MRRDLDPSVWGRAGWAFLGSCAHAVDEHTQAHYHQLLRLLPEVLPCGKCRRHSRDYLSQNPPEEAADLEKWLQHFEAAVAQRKAKGEQLPPSPVMRAGPLLLCLLLCACVAVAAARAWPRGEQSFAQR